MTVSNDKTEAKSFISWQNEWGYYNRSAKLNIGMKKAIKGLFEFRAGLIEAYAKMDTAFLMGTMKWKQPKPPKTHAAHRTMSDRKAAGGRGRKPHHKLSLRQKRRIGLWNV